MSNIFMVKQVTLTDLDFISQTKQILGEIKQQLYQIYQFIKLGIT